MAWRFRCYPHECFTGFDSQACGFARLSDMPAAYVDKSVLDAAGIRCYLQDANMVRMGWLWSNAMGGIKLVVREADVEDAAKILESEPPQQADETGR